MDTGGSRSAGAGSIEVLQGLSAQRPGVQDTDLGSPMFSRKGITARLSSHCFVLCPDQVREVLTKKMVAYLERAEYLKQVLTTRNLYRAASARRAKR